MQGHAAANMVPLVAANRTGEEAIGDSRIRFYGSSFIAGHTGEKVAEAGRDQEAILVAGFDLDAIEDRRAQWGIFRDRRPCMYGRILTCDGTVENGSHSKPTGGRPGH